MLTPLIIYNYVINYELKYLKLCTIKLFYFFKLYRLSCLKSVIINFKEDNKFGNFKIKK